MPLVLALLAACSSRTPRETPPELIRAFGNRQLISRVDFSPDGTSLAVSETSEGKKSSRNVRIWSVATGEHLRLLEGHTAAVNEVEYTGDGQHLVSASADETVIVWSTRTWEPVHTLTHHEEGVGALAIRDGVAVTGDRSGTIKAWRVSSGEVLWSAQTEAKRPIYVARFSPDGAVVATAGNAWNVELWNAATGAHLESLRDRKFSTQPSILDVAFSPDGKQLVSVSSDKTVDLWDLETGTLVHRPLRDHEGHVNAVVWHPDGHWFATGGGNSSTHTVDGVIRLWDPRTGKVVKRLQDHVGAIQSLDISPDGSILASGSFWPRIELWTVQSEASW